MPRVPPRPRVRAGADLWLAALAFLALAVAGTWPLAGALTSSLPGDYGDPLFVTWVMAWVARHLTRALTGDPGALTAMWDAPIFSPETNTLAFSEHFVGQAFQALPIYWLTGNPLLAYNVIFLSTFVLSGVGGYLLVRELTASRLGGLVAGALLTVNDFRTSSLSHLHTLSSHWVPLALLGLLLFARSGSRLALAGAAVSTIALNTSSGYYMLYCGPMVAAFAVMVLARHTAWRTRAGWTALAVAVAVVALVQVPLVLPYLELQRTMQFARTRGEVEMFSVPLDLYRDRLPYLAPMLLLSGASLLAWRAKGVGLRWALVFFGVAGVLGLWLSLGPVPRLHGVPSGLPGLYDLLYTFVPGYSGLRVASRFTVVVMVSLSVLAGLGAAALVRRAGRAGAALAVAGAAAHLSLHWMGPIALDVPLLAAGLQPAPAYLRPAVDVPGIYRAVASTPSSSVLAELPFGDPGYELRYMFFGLAHARPLLNGYSGIFPPSYRTRAAVLVNPQAAPDAAWAALAPATHVVVHGRAWDDDRGTAIGDWLAGRGARVIAERDGAKLWHLPSSR
jgi:hypothetical protein